MSWLVKILRNPHEPDDADPRLAPLTPAPDPKFDRYRQELDDIIARGKRAGYEFDIVARRKAEPDEYSDNE